MIDTPLLTAEQFAEQRFEFGDGGRWVELSAGRVVSLRPPDEAHGTVVLNLSKSVAAYLREAQAGYACFDLGLIVAREPDTVRFPAMCCFVEGPRFAEADKEVTATRPALVAEVASTVDRRRTMQTRIQQYLDWQVSLVWVIDPAGQEVEVFQPGRPATTLRPSELLHGDPVLSTYEVAVEELFAAPSWWK